MRGYTAIALDNPKKEPNVGGVLRAAAIFGVSLVIIRGGNIKSLNFTGDTCKAWKHLPTIIATEDNFFDIMPHGCIPIAVEIAEKATPLPYFSHPERAMYIFGRENSSLDKKVLDRCAEIVMIPTRHCMNLSSCCNVVLYDRLCKKMQNNVDKPNTVC